MRPRGKPFRWNIANPKVSARLKAGETQSIPEHDRDRLLRCGAQTLRTGNFDYVFVGRSLESLFDMLSGALSKTKWYDRLQLLQLSIRGHKTLNDIRDEIEEYRARYRSLKLPSAEEKLADFGSYLEFCQLTPTQIVDRLRDVVFVDTVATGATLGTFLELLEFYCDDTTDWEAVKKRLHWVVVQPDAAKMKDPNWKPADSPWTDNVEPNQIHQVILNADLWCFLADAQFKTTYSFHPTAWGRDDNSRPPDPEYDWYAYAARGSRELYRIGERSRRRLAALLDESPEPQDAIKGLAQELRREERNW